MATPNHSPVLPGRGSARFNDHTQCFETLAGASIPAEWVPPGRTITAPAGDWLWVKLMDFCKKRGFAPANFNDLFEIVDAARAARIAELESQLAQRFDAADMATAAAQGFRDGATATAQPVAEQASADSVQEEAARYRWLRDGNDAKHGAAWHVAVNLYGCEWDAAIDAARKQGETP